MAETERLDGRDGRIWSAYVGGASQEAIAAEHSISQQRVSQVLAGVREGIGDTVRTDAALLARERTDALLAAVWPAAMEGDTRAVTAALKVLERQAKAMGTDASEPLRVTLERRNDTEAGLVADAVVGALEVLGLDEEQRQLALQAAVAILSGEEPPAPAAAPVVELEVVQPDLEARYREFLEEHGLEEDDEDDEDDGE